MGLTVEQIISEVEYSFGRLLGDVFCRAGKSNESEVNLQLTRT